MKIGETVRKWTSCSHYNRNHKMKILVSWNTWSRKRNLELCHTFFGSFRSKSWGSFLLYKKNCASSLKLTETRESAVTKANAAAHQPALCDNFSGLKTHRTHTARAGAKGPNTVSPFGFVHLLDLKIKMLQGFEAYGVQYTHTHTVRRTRAQT